MIYIGFGLCRNKGKPMSIAEDRLAGTEEGRLSPFSAAKD
jgi:hypothetical protein